jgi:hypothetical protein
MSKFIRLNPLWGKCFARIAGAQTRVVCDRNLSHLPGWGFQGPQSAADKRHDLAQGRIDIVRAAESA